VLHRSCQCLRLGQTQRVNIRCRSAADALGIEAGTISLCAPSAPVMSPAIAIIVYIDMVHPVDRVDMQWHVLTDQMGKYSFKFDYEPADMMARGEQAQGSTRVGGHMPDSLFAFDVAHSRTPRVDPPSPPPPFEATNSGVYPTIFELTISGSRSTERIRLQGCLSLPGATRRAKERCYSLGSGTPDVSLPAS
jgi:hypothetical protein